MQRNGIIRKIVITALIIYAFVAVVLAIISFINYSLLIGWLVGGAVAFASYFLGIFLTGFIFKKPETKTKMIGFALGWMRVWIQMLCHAGILIAIIAIDKAANGKGILDGTFHDIMHPINIIAYIFGIGIMAVSTLVAHTLNKKGGKHGQI